MNHGHGEDADRDRRRDGDHGSQTVSRQAKRVGWHHDDVGSGDGWSQHDVLVDQWSTSGSGGGERLRRSSRQDLDDDDAITDINLARMFRMQIAAPRAVWDGGI